MKRHNHGTWRLAVALSLGALSVLSVTSAAPATPIVDGRFDPAEGYTLGRFVDFTVEGVGATVGGGQLWTHQDGPDGDVYVAFIQPLALLDNTYGANSVGWGQAAPSGKRHNFKDLTGSDKAQFVFTDGLGNVALDVTVDYMSETSKGSGVFASLGVEGGEGRVEAGSADDVVAWATSLDYNFNELGFELTEDSPATDANYAENPDYAGWVFPVVYELRVSGGAFGGDGFGDVTVPVVHDSPNKIGKNKVFPETGEEIPEPGTLGLLGVCAGLCLRRRGQR